MPEASFERAREFLYRSGRVLERRLFARLYEDGDADGVVAAVLAYRNADGGFGHGLEPDKLAPQSQPLDVQFALQRLTEAGADARELGAAACDFLETDVASGYVRILQEMIAAGWSDAEVAASVREMVGGWYRLLGEVARREEKQGADLFGFTPEEVAALMATPFLGAEELILLGVQEETLPIRSALRKVGVILRRIGEPDASSISSSTGR